MSTAFNPTKVLQERPWLERAIGAIAPSWELRRMQSRVARHLFEYQASVADRLFAPKTWSNPSESSQTARSRSVMMHEARDLVENFGPAKVILTKYAENIAPTEYAPATGDRDYDGVVADYFHAWCKRCDFLGVNSFKKLIEIAVMTRPQDGDCGVVMRRMKDDAIRLQLVAGDRIGSPNEAVTSDKYFSGVTVDSFGRPITYRIYRVLPSGVYADPEDIPAENFLHYFDPFRSDQYRGVTDFHAVLRTARMLKDILEAEQIGVKFASQQAALIFNENGVATPRNVFTPTAQTTLPNGETKQEEYSEFGVLRYLTRGDKVEVMPSRPGSAFQGFTNLLMEHFSLGIGVPKGVLFGTAEYKGPSIRAEFAQADRTFSRQKSVLADKVLDPAKDAVLLNAIATGELSPPARQAGETSVQAIKRMLRGSWRFPPKLTIDVGRESDAKINENQAGLRSAQEIAADENADAFERLEANAQIAAEVKRLAEKYEVPETTIRLVGKVLPSTPAAAAAAGENVGEDASEAQASSVPSAAGEKPEDNPNPNPKPESDDEENTVAGRLNRRSRTRKRALGELIARSQRLSDVRARIGRTAFDAEQIKKTINTLSN